MVVRYYFYADATPIVLRHTNRANRFSTPIVRIVFLCSAPILFNNGADQMRQRLLL